MTDPRELLDQITQRVDRMTTPDPTGIHRYSRDEYGRIAPDTYLTDDDRKAGDYDPIGHIAADLRSLVAALRAALDNLDEYGATPDEFGMAADIRHTITEALGGTS